MRGPYPALAGSEQTHIKLFERDHLLLTRSRPKVKMAFPLFAPVTDRCLDFGKRDISYPSGDWGGGSSVVRIASGCHPLLSQNQVD
jgi:hypothetical protein